MVASLVPRPSAMIARMGFRRIAPAVGLFVLSPWGLPHRVALAGGALLAYAGGAFTTEPESAPKQGVDYVVNAVLAVAAVVLLVVAVRRSARPRGVTEPSAVQP